VPLPIILPSLHANHVLFPPFLFQVWNSSPYTLAAFAEALLLTGVTLALVGDGSSMKTTLEKE